LLVTIVLNWVLYLARVVQLCWNLVSSYQDLVKCRKVDKTEKKNSTTALWLNLFFFFMIKIWSRHLSLELFFNYGEGYHRDNWHREFRKSPKTGYLDGNGFTHCLICQYVFWRYINSEIWFCMCSLGSKLNFKILNHQY
jgi:hypothetical protein